MTRGTQAPAEGSVEHAFELLKQALEKAIRAEQLRDPLTGLANNGALSELFEDWVEDGNTEYWVAFVEVDRFKNINDTYGYEAADELLKRIGHRLQSAARDYFAAGTTAFRAHGDEFYLAGPKPKNEEDVRTRLDRIRAEIETVRVEVLDKHKEPMSCTVSIGWLTLDDSMKSAALSPRSVRTHLEAAVAKAKLERNTVVRFDPSILKTPVADGRADCKECHARFSVSVPLTQLQEGFLCCPNCGTKVDRPPGLTPKTHTLKP